jgi:hypothetical protein
MGTVPDDPNARALVESHLDQALKQARPHNYGNEHNGKKPMSNLLLVDDERRAFLIICMVTIILGIVLAITFIISGSVIRA